MIRLFIAFFIAAVLLAGCAQAAKLPAVTPALEPIKQVPPTALPSPTATPFPPDPQIEPTPEYTTHTPTPETPVCTKSSGVMVLASLESEKLTRPMAYRVFLPPCYNDEPDLRYPVLYMIHGQSYNNDQWDRLGMDDAAARLIFAGELAPFLIVMPEDIRWTEPDEDPFGDVFMNELLPLIDETYRTLPEANYRAVGGLSRGAAWAVHLGVLHPDVFGAIGGHSLPVFWTDTPHLRDWLAKIPAGQMPRFYLDDGTKDRYLDSAVWFEKLLTEEGIAHEWYLFEGYHEEKYWSAHVVDYLRFYAAEW